AAQANGDRNLVDEMIPSSEVAGVPIQFGNEKLYGFGELPLGDAFLAWAKSTGPWMSNASAQAPYKSEVFWRLTFQLASLMFIGMIWLPWYVHKIVRIFKARKQDHSPQMRGE